MTKATRINGTVYFGSNLKYLRQRKGKSRIELAYLLGIREDMIGEYEAGIIEPDHYTLLQISHYFNIGLQEFIQIDLTEDQQEWKNHDPDLYVRNDFDHFIKCTQQAQNTLDEILSMPTIVETSKDQEVKIELNRLIKLMKLILDGNWALIKTIKEYYQSHEER